MSCLWLREGLLNMRSNREKQPYVFRRNISSVVKALLVLTAFAFLLSVFIYNLDQLRAWLPIANRPALARQDALSSSADTYHPTCHTCQEDIISKLTNRIQRRILNGQSVLQWSSRTQSPESIPTKFLTHDLINAVGLGNFMFMAASTLGLAESSGRTPFFNVKMNKHMDVFQPRFPLVQDLPDSDKKGVLAIRHPVMVDIPSAGIYNSTLIDWLDIKRNTSQAETASPVITLHGYLQSWKYFQTQQPLIRSQFTFSEAIYHKAMITLKNAVKVQANVTTVIGVHVRRGDMILNESFKRYGHTVATDTYLINVLTSMMAMYQGAVFIILSNDMPYCRHIMRDMTNAYFVEGNTPSVDMAILTLMDYLILTVGTFGWWGAYLSDAREVYYFRDWPRNGTALSREYSSTDYFPSSWKPSS